MAAKLALCLVAALSTNLQATAASIPGNCPSVQFDRISGLPSGWQYYSSPVDTIKIPFKIALRYPHHDYLELAHEVSNPDSAQYGMHLSKAQLLQAMPDVEHSAKAVQSWLHSQNITSSYSAAGGWVTFDTTIADAEVLFDAKYAFYSYNGSAPILRTLSYSIPGCVAGDVDFVWPTTQFLVSSLPAKDKQHGLNSRQIGPRDTVDCTSNPCPSYLQKRYNVTYSPPDKTSGSKLALAGFLGDHPDTQDFKSFLKSYGLRNDSDYQSYNFTVEAVNGGSIDDTPSSASVEAMLDTEYSATFINPLDTTYFATGGRPPTWSQPGNVTVPDSQSENEPYLDLINHILQLDDPPQVLSMSYADDEQSVPPTYAERVCNGFGALAARGITVIASSGDGGAAGTSYGTCVGPSGEERFIPTFPASCPWVTSVGALAAWGGSASYSSGGFSNYFAAPTWQAASTAAYVEGVLANSSKIPAGFYNASGRGVPDIALLGDRYPVITNGETSLQKGTSASAPFFAALIVLINDIRLRQGKSAVGFINPLLYSEDGRALIRDVADDISSIEGCEQGEVFVNGYPAAPGWDPASGLGEPGFESLKAIFV